MKPIEFEGHNRVYAKDQPEYLPLPAHVEIRGCGTVTSCWKLTAMERIKVLITGRLWLQQLAFGHPLQPQRPSIDKPIMVNHE